MLRMQREAGFTLVELMVSMVIGLFLIGGVIAVFTANSQSYRFQQALADVQDGGDFVLAQMVNDIRMSGFGQSNNALAAFNAANLPDYASGAVATTTEVIQFTYEDVTDRDNDAATTSITRGYFLRNNADGRSTLMVHDSLDGNSPIELLDGVEQVVYTYLVDSDGDGNFDTDNLFAGMNALNRDWENTVGIRMEVLVSSAQRNVLSTNQNLPAPFNNFTQQQNRYYQVFTTTVEMRNR